MRESRSGPPVHDHPVRTRLPSRGVWLLGVSVLLAVAAAGAVIMRDGTPASAPEGAEMVRSSESASMQVTDGVMETMASSLGGLERDPTTPTLRAVSIPVSPDGRPSSSGQPVTAIRVEATVLNETDRTFTLPRAQVAVRMTLDGRPYEDASSTGDSVELRPGDSHRTTIEVPLEADGLYEWHAVAFYVDG